jgi:hypothetical protein
MTFPASEDARTATLLSFLERLQSDARVARWLGVGALVLQVVPMMALASPVFSTLLFGLMMGCAGFAVGLGYATRGLRATLLTAPRRAGGRSVACADPVEEIQL